MMDQVAKAIAVRWDGSGPVDWLLSVPRRMVEELQPLCNATDEFLLDHPGYRVTLVVERHWLPDTGTEV